MTVFVAYQQQGIVNQHASKLIKSKDFDFIDQLIFFFKDVNLVLMVNDVKIKIQNRRVIVSEILFLEKNNLH
jgi:hypothetical protein